MNDTRRQKNKAGQKIIGADRSDLTRERDIFHRHNGLQRRVRKWSSLRRWNGESTALYRGDECEIGFIHLRGAWKERSIEELNRKVPLIEFCNLGAETMLGIWLPSGRRQKSERRKWGDGRTRREGWFCTSDWAWSRGCRTISSKRRYWWLTDEQKFQNMKKGKRICVAKATSVDMIQITCLSHSEDCKYDRNHWRQQQCQSNWLQWSVLVNKLQSWKKSLDLPYFLQFLVHFNAWYN